MLPRLGRVVILMLLLAAACAQQQPQVIELPTLAVLPSFTPSNTPTLTSTPTDTLTPTATDTPTNTLTFTPTLTATPSVTVTASLTATFTLTPTSTSTFTPIPSDTPTLTFTPNAPSILSFLSSATSGTPGASITLQWQTIADSARIDQLNQQGAVMQTFSVVPTGQLVVGIPSGAGQLVVYKLVAIRGGQETSQSIPIQVSCPIPWFFGDQYAPPNSGCPTAVGAVASGKFQQFERGVMIFVTANGLNTIYGLQNDGNRYIAYVNTWDGGGLTYNDPPSGLFKPREDFRWAFLNTLAPIGTWQDAIGWGVSDINHDARTIQNEQSGAFYIDAPTGVYRFSGGSSGTWSKIR